MYALPDSFGAIPGGLGLGGAVFAAAVAILALLNEQKAGDQKKLNEGIEKSFRKVFGFIGRYLSGRELIGAPRSEATWWKPGAPLPDIQQSETPLSQLGTGAHRVSLVKELGNQRLRTFKTGAIFSPFRLFGRSVAGVWRVLRAWHRWPRFARAMVRLLPAPFALGIWKVPNETRLGLLVAAAVVCIAALTGPAGTGWWRVRVKWTDRQIYGPGLWVVIRQVIRVEETEPRDRWLLVPDDMKAEGARIVLRLPAKWVGGPDSVAAIERIIEERVPGDWESQWERTTKDHYVEWKPKPKPTPKPVLPDYVPWKSTGDPRRVFVGLSIEANSVVDAVINTKSETPHWGVAGDTGSGKSTVLYIPVVHGRQNGELIDILDTKRNSLAEAQGASGVRIHKTVRECISAFAEFLTSMMAAEAAMEKGADPDLRVQLTPRTLVVDELPTLIKLAYTWWRYGLKGKGTPPFLDWLAIILLQGRSSNHRIVVGTQQFANAFFGGTMERSQIGTRITVGQQDRISWGVAFGQSTPVLGYDTSVKGRGAFSDKRKDPEADYLYVREIQPCFITPEVARLLAECPPAADWFDAGHMAPWITDEVLTEVNATAATAAFLPGGKYGPPALPGVAPAGVRGIEGGTPSSQPTTPVRATEDTTGDTTGDTTDVEALLGTQEEALPATYSLADAHAEGILPWKAATVRTYFKRGEQRGIPVPAGITDGQTAYYSEEELRLWLAAWEKWQKENGVK